MNDRGTSDLTGPHTEPLSISVDQDGEQSIVRLNGELDLASVDAFSSAIREARGSGAQHFAVDARDLTFVDSAGLQALLVARQVTVAAGGSFAIRHSSTALKRMLEFAGLAEIFVEADGG